MKSRLKIMRMISVSSMILLAMFLTSCGGGEDGGSTSSDGSGGGATYYIEGHIRFTDGSGLSGVTVECLSDNGLVHLWDTTDSSGYYKVTGLSANTYKVMACCKPGYAYTFLSSVTVPPSQSNIDLTMTLKDEWDCEVTLTVNNLDSSLRYETRWYRNDRYKYFASTDYGSWISETSWTITPTLSFSSSEHTLKISIRRDIDGEIWTSSEYDINNTTMDITISPEFEEDHSISGQVVTSDGTGLSEVTITLSGDASDTDTTDSSGDYSFSGLSNGEYLIEPSKTDYLFDPAGINVTISGSDASEKDFTALNFDTNVEEEKSQYIDASIGGTIEITDSSSPLYGVKLTIPPYALSESSTITISVVNNAPFEPDGYTHVTPCIAISAGSGQSTASIEDNMYSAKAIQNPLTLTVKLKNALLRDGGIADTAVASLRALSSYTQNDWQFVSSDDYKINTEEMEAIIFFTEFARFWIVGYNANAPSNLGTPYEGCLLYKLGDVVPGLGLSSGGKIWRPGHVGIYTGEKPYPGGRASDEVKEFEMYNVVEALLLGVQYSYYDIPNVTEKHEDSLDPFSGSDIYMGAREPIGKPLSDSQWEKIVSYVEERVGKRYALYETASGAFGSGLAKGSEVKGPDKYNCVGLAEAAYEYAGIGLVSDANENEEPSASMAALTPAEHYAETEPAGEGENPVPEILSANLTPNQGDWDTLLLLEVKVSHDDGLTAIESVTYVTSDGYTNPQVWINDQGQQGDVTAGDGIYSVSAIWGSEESGYIKVTVADIFGNATTSSEIEYDYEPSVSSAMVTDEATEEELPAFYRKDSLGK